MRKKEKTKIITLKNPKKVFPYKYIVLRPHDLINLVNDKKKYLTKREKEEIIKFVTEVRRGYFEGCFDLIAVRKKNKIIIKSFEEKENKRRKR